MMLDVTRTSRERAVDDEASKVAFERRSGNFVFRDTWQREEMSSFQDEAGNSRRERDVASWLSRRSWWSLAGAWEVAILVTALGAAH